MKTAFALLVVLFCGCGDNTAVPDCGPVIDARLCPNGVDVICRAYVDGVPAPVTECLVWHRPVADQPLVAALCVAACAP